jgi:hypothetical protein
MSMVKKDERFATFKMAGQQAGRQTLSGRLVSERYNLADGDPEKRPIDELLIRHFRRLETIIRPDRQTAAG